MPKPEKKYTQSELSELLGLTPGYLSTMTSRGKVIRDSDKKYNAAETVNADFIKKQLVKKHGEAAETSKLFSQIAGKQPDSIRSKHELDLEQKQLDIDKRREEIRKLQLQNEKMEGELIPADLVKDIFRRNGKTMTTAFSQAIESYLTILEGEVRMTSKQTAKMRKQIIATTNDAIDEGVKLSVKEISALVNEFSEKRERGQRK